MPVCLLVSLVLLVSCTSAETLGGQEQQPAPSPGSHSTQQAPQRVRVSSGVATKLLVTRVDPDYPKDLRKRRVQGMVVLNVRIGRDGNVIDVAPVSGPSELIQSASDAVKQWKFKPYLLNGQAVVVETQILINFSLAGS
jgi:protein TonB